MTTTNLTRTEAAEFATEVRAHFAREIRVDNTPEAADAKRELLDAIESYIANGDVETGSTLEQAAGWVREDFGAEIARVESL